MLNIKTKLMNSIACLIFYNNSDDIITATPRIIICPINTYKNYQI